MQIKATAGYHPHTSGAAFSLIPIYLIHDNQKASVGMWKSKTRKVKRPVQGQRAGSHWVTNSILLKYLGNGKIISRGWRCPLENAQAGSVAGTGFCVSPSPILFADS